ncbi:hypothetical protein CBS9595_004207 [Malassezia furfur]|nr:hypothetical protein CBS9595_004207 [Malassezia furfur]
MKARAFGFAVSTVSCITTALCATSTDYALNLPDGTAVYTASPAFPTSDFGSMDLMPSAHEAEPRPVITSLGSGRFNDTLVNPTMLPNPTPTTTGVLPEPTQGASGGFESQDSVVQNITDLLRDPNSTPCDTCRKVLSVGQSMARTTPSNVSDTLVELCVNFNYTKSQDPRFDCEARYGAAQMGPMYTQLLSYANLTNSTAAADHICAYLVDEEPCPKINISVYNDRGAFYESWFNRSGPEHPILSGSRRKVGPARDKPLRVLHLSDIHLDPRYMVGGEANCDSGQCCRADSYNSSLAQPTFEPGTLPKENISEPAGYWGWYQCDSPWSLVESAMQAISALAQQDGPFDLGIVTGDLVTHDSTARISPDLVRYSEQSIYDLLRQYVKNATIIVAIGTEDTAPPDQAMPNDLPDDRGKQLDWDYENIAALIQAEGWGGNNTAVSIRTHYGGYSMSPRQGLRVISVNSDFWSVENLFNYLNPDDPDPSGTFRWLTDELTSAESANETAWIVASVPTGWEGTAALPRPSMLFNLIMNRFAETVAHVFFGHTHEDQFYLFFDESHNSTGARDNSTLSGHAFIAPSLTPNRNLQPSFRIYDVDPETYEVMNYHQYYTSVSELQNLTDQGPIWRELYSARETFANYTMIGDSNNQTSWPTDAPLNATFWMSLTDEMKKDTTLIDAFNLYQGRNSPRTPACDYTCQQSKLCYMRTGNSFPLDACDPGYGSVQSAYPLSEVTPEEA